ncbi:MAG: prepilin-type N-terminal cleavage/methylation domain-containing protein [Ruminococcus sp.]|nr:prepilin-type N-terminal cleavage/methylation domain-containing protein [Ruminococcus sp.]
MKNKRKTFKGMTLMEIIISLAVLAVLTLILVHTSTTINMYIKSTKNINQKVTAQAPVAEMGYVAGASALPTSDLPEVFVNWSGNAGAAIAMDAVAYQAGEVATVAVTDAEGNIISYEEANVLGGNLAMQFLEVHDPTTTATT